VRCSALQCVAVRCSALQCVAVRCSALHLHTPARHQHSRPFQHSVFAVRSVLQCVALCCSALQCVALAHTCATSAQQTISANSRATTETTLSCTLFKSSRVTGLPAVCCSVHECVALCCTVLHCVALYCSVLNNAQLQAPQH